MANEFNLIQAKLEHIEIVASLFDAYRQFYGQKPDREGARAFVLERLQQEQSVVLLALQDGNGSGFVQLYPAFSSVAMRSIWILNDLFVAREARRRGVGKSLLQAATDFAADNGAKRLELATAIDNNAAQLLYEEMGWVRNDAFIHYNHEL